MMRLAALVRLFQGVLNDLEIAKYPEMVKWNNAHNKETSKQINKIIQPTNYKYPVLPQGFFYLRKKYEKEQSAIIEAT